MGINIRLANERDFTLVLIILYLFVGGRWTQIYVVLAWLVWRSCSCSRKVDLRLRTKWVHAPCVEQAEAVPSQTK